MHMTFDPDELDFDRLPEIIAAMIAHDDELFAAFTNGDLFGRVGMAPFDSETGLAPVFIDGVKFGAIHYGRLLRGIPLDLSDNPPTVLPRPE